MKISKITELLKRFSKYLLTALALAIMTVSSIPSIPTLRIHAGDHTIRLDYLIHFLEYGVLAILAYVTFSGENFSLSSKRYIAVTSALIIYALTDEFHQKLIPGRSFNTHDILSNITGITAALVIYLLLTRRFIKARGQI